MTKDQVLKAWEFFDKDKSGRINPQEFLLAMHYVEDEVIKGSGSFIDQLTAAHETSKEDEKNITTKLKQRLIPFKDLLCLQENGRDATMPKNQEETALQLDLDPDFVSPFSPTQMRCLALVCHESMRDTMREFVSKNQNVLKKFRLTGTKLTMRMLRQVFGNDPKVVYGITCEPGPLGGDAQLVAEMCNETLGGMIFFQDPMVSHIHQVDIDCLNRQSLIYNVLVATNTSSALMMTSHLRHALMDNKPELIPSFFSTLQCPSVQAYKKRQNQIFARMATSATGGLSVSGLAAALADK